MKRFEFLFKPKFMIPFAILLSGLATIAVYRYIQQQKESIEEPKVVFHNVVVALQDLPVGTTLDPTLLTVAQWPTDIIPEGSFTTPSFLDGRVLKSNVYAKEPILMGDLSPLGSAGGFSSIIPKGKRAATVKVDIVSGVSGFILPNTYVDVLATVTPTGKQEDMASKIVLENIKVLAVDQLFQRQTDEPVTVQSVTLLVTPEESEKLALACTEGELQLTMRNSTDSVKVETTPRVWLKDLLEGKKQPVSTVRRVRRAPRPQEPPKKKPRSIEVIRATEKEVITFGE